ncbi:MAG: hypothetical protein JO061_24570 [Acidobacteriaceae bacterium]|nr:hypothetical protein [Acidobacteriaceae bacterium]
MTTVAPFPAAVATKRTLTTPQILWRGLWALWAGDALLLGLVLSAGHVQHAAMKTIGQDSAPSIIASQQIKTALADMDANAANELIADPATAAASVQAYSKRRREAATALIAAAQNITYGEAERIPILRIQLELGTYEALIQRARDLHQEGDRTFISAYNQAAQLLDGTILPAADALDQANLKELDAAYSGQRYQSVTTRSLVAVGALIVLIALAVVQLFLFNRTHRLINIPIFTATLLLVVFTLLTLQELNSAARNLKRAKEDAFTSIHALWRARAVAYAANADESRFLLDPQHASERTQAFYNKRDLLAKLPAGATYDSVTPNDFTGYLADELNNITFRGEREAANETLTGFGRYVAVDGQIRDLERRGQHKQAVELCTGTAPGQSDWAFDQFDTALGRTLKINQDAFDASIAEGFGVLRYFDLKAGIFAGVIAVLCLFGLLQRIREYQ